jgi:hypothetical protein
MYTSSAFLYNDKNKGLFQVKFCFLKTRATLGEFPRSIEAVAEQPLLARRGGCHSAPFAAQCFISPGHRRPQILSATIRAVLLRNFKNRSQVKDLNI